VGEASLFALEGMEPVLSLILLPSLY